jgi:hypothetical protein
LAKEIKGPVNVCRLRDVANLRPRAMQRHLASDTAPQLSILC